VQGKGRGAHRDWWEKPRENSHLEEQGTDGRIVLKRIFKKKGRTVDWIYLAHDKDKRSAVVNAVMNLRVPHNGGEFLGWLRNCQLLK
jgi:hypothetical protein